MLSVRIASCALAVAAVSAAPALAQSDRAALYDRAGYVVYDAGRGDSLSADRSSTQPPRRVVGAPLVGYERYDTAQPARIITRPTSNVTRVAEQAVTRAQYDGRSRVTAATPATAEPVYTTTSTDESARGASLFEDDAAEGPHVAAVSVRELSPRYVESSQAAIVRRDEPVYRYSTQPRYTVRYVEPIYATRTYTTVYHEPVVYRSHISVGYSSGHRSYGHIGYGYHHSSYYGHHRYHKHYGHRGHYRHHGHYRHRSHCGSSFSFGIHLRF